MYDPKFCCRLCYPTCAGEPDLQSDPDDSLVEFADDSPLSTVAFDQASLESNLYALSESYFIAS